MKKNILDETYIASPLDVRHFILDIPVLKGNYQMNAVRYALKSLYPGNEETTSIDYAVIKDRVIGIAVNSQKIEELKKTGKKIVSPVLLASKTVKNGIVIQWGKGWIEIQKTEMGVPQFIKTYGTSQIDACIHDIRNIMSQNNNSKTDILAFCYDKTEIFLEQKMIQLELPFKDIWTKVTSSDINSSKIYCDHKNVKNNFVKYLIAILFVVLAGLDLLMFKKANAEKKTFETIKTEYLAEKQKIQKKISFTVMDNEISFPETESMSSILSELASLSSSMRILSLNINGDSIKFEAEKANAIQVLEKLTSSVLFKDIILHQAIPQDDGTERFVISGRLNNE